jgi:hypothetical protein
MRSGLAFVLCVCLLFSAYAGAAKTPLPSFRSPSGNIRCFDAGVLHCAIAQANYATTLQQRCITGAGVDWHGFELSASGVGTISCSGGILYNPDTQAPRYPKLPYGRTWRDGGFICGSAVTGVTCHNRAGAGLFISRQSWRRTTSR